MGKGVTRAHGGNAAPGKLTIEKISSLCTTIPRLVKGGLVRREEKGTDLQDPRSEKNQRGKVKKDGKKDDTTSCSRSKRIRGGSTSRVGNP